MHPFTLAARLALATAGEREGMIAGMAKAKKAEKAASKATALLEKAEELQEKAESRVDPAGPTPLADLLRVGPDFRLADVDPRSTPGFDGGKTAGAAALAAGGDRLSELQERLFAAAKGGTAGACCWSSRAWTPPARAASCGTSSAPVDPQGVRITAFKAPTPEERQHDFLWRIRNALPQPGNDRRLRPVALRGRARRPGARARPAGGLAAALRDDQPASSRAGRVRARAVVKVMLHISPDEQKQRLAQRLDRPDKYWKYNPGDVDERMRWDDYQEAYQAALTRCSTDAAPWYVVPADRKWYARWAVQQLLLDALEGIDPQWPPADFDVEPEKARLAAT